MSNNSFMIVIMIAPMKPKRKSIIAFFKCIMSSAEAMSSRIATSKRILSILNLG